MLNDLAFRSFFENSPQPMWVYDLAELHFLTVNDAACLKYGYSRDEFARMTLFDIRRPSERERLREALSSVDSESQEETSGVWEHLTKDGEPVYMEVLTTRIELESGAAGFAVLRDVTQERSTEALLGRLYQLSQDLMIIRAADDRLISINPAFERILGWTVEECFETDPTNWIHPDDRVAREAARFQATNTPSTQRWEGRMVGKDGQYRWLQWYGAVDQDTGLWYSVGRDITEARLQSDQLKSSQANLAWAQQVSHVGSWTLDIPTMRFSLSDEYYRIMGFEPGGFEPTMENIAERVHPEDRHFVAGGPRFLHNGGRQPETINVRLVRPDGDVRYARSFVQVEFGADDAPLTAHGIIHDVTDLERAEESRTWLAAITSSSGEAIIGAALDGTIMTWNATAEKMFGFSSAEIVGQQLLKIIPPSQWDEAERILQGMRNAITVPEFDTELIRKNGNSFEASLLVSPIKTTRGRLIGAAAMCRDVSERNRAQRHIQAQLAQLSALRLIDSSIVRTFNLTDTLEVVGAEVLKTIDCESVFLFHARTDQSCLEETVVALRADSSLVTDEEHQHGRLVSEAAFDQQRAASTGTVRATFLGHEQHRGVTQAYDARPLIAKGSVVGVLTVCYRVGIKRPLEQFHFLDALAGQAAIAIESATLFVRLALSRDELSGAYDETLEGWARAMDLRDRETEGHSRRVAEMTVDLAKIIKVDDSELVHMWRGGLLHDIGKLAIPDEILLKPGALNEEEWQVMRKHPRYALDFLGPISFLRPALPIPYNHHEKWDGSGYPEGLFAETIPLPARIFAFADVWDALRSDRPYRKAWPVDQALQYVKEQAGKHFDPGIAPVFLQYIGSRNTS